MRSEWIEEFTAGSDRSKYICSRAFTSRSDRTSGHKARRILSPTQNKVSDSYQENDLNKTEDDATSECRQALELRVRDDFPYLKYVIEVLDALKREQIKL